MATRTIRLRNSALLPSDSKYDKLRGELDGNGAETDFRDSTPGFNVPKVEVSSEPAEIVEDTLFPSLRQKIKISGKPAFFHDGAQNDPDRMVWRRFVNQTIKRRTYHAFHAEFEIPMADETNVFTDPSALDSEFVYNYEFYRYDYLTSLVDERSLPSHMLFHYAEHVKTNGNYLPLLSTDIMTYRGNFDHTEVSTLKVVEDLKGNDINRYLFNPNRAKEVAIDPENTLEVKQYEDNYFQFYTNKRILDKETFDAPVYNFDLSIEKAKNIFMFYDYKPERTDLLPYYLRINIPPMSINDDFDAGSIGGFDGAFSQTRMNRFLFAHIKRQAATNMDFKLGSTDSDTPKYTQYKTWDLLSWWENASFANFSEADDERFLMDEEDVRLDGPSAIFERAIRKVIALGSVRTAIIDKLKDFHECVEELKVDPKTIIGYKVEKRVEQTGQLLQNFYFPSDGGKETIDFIDSQIAYDKKYKYSVSVISVILGSKYRYSNININSDDLTVEFDFINEPCMKICEIPIHESIERAIEPPPLPPKVQVFHERGTKNKVKFILSDRYGNRLNESLALQHLDTGATHNTDPETLSYITVLESDQAYKQKLFDSSKSNVSMYGFSSRAASQKFQIFRINTKPESYSDFGRGLLGDISEFLVYDDKDLRGPVLFTDYIAHEQKQYYLFRALSTHENPSNPSFVYEVELLEDSDEVIMKVDSFQIYPKAQKSGRKRSFRRFMQIKPNSRHTVVDPEQFTLGYGSTDLYGTQGLSLGNVNAPLGSGLWEYSSKETRLTDSTKGDTAKYIKLRLVSKQTGKKIDLNLTFNIEDKTNS